MTFAGRVATLGTYLIEKSCHSILIMNEMKDYPFWQPFGLDVESSWKPLITVLLAILVHQFIEGEKEKSGSQHFSRLQALQ